MSVRDEVAAAVLQASRDYYFAAEHPTMLSEEGEAAAIADAVLAVPAVARAIAIAQRAEDIDTKARPWSGDPWDSGYRHCLDNILRPPNPHPDGDVAANTRRNMKRLGIPEGTADPGLIALGAKPLDDGPPAHSRADVLRGLPTSLHLPSDLLADKYRADDV